MTPPRAPMDDPTTGELRFLDAAAQCKSSQAALREEMSDIKAALTRLEAHAATISTMAGGLNKLGATMAVGLDKIGAWLTSWSWKGGLVLLAVALSPWIVGIGGTLLLAGQAPAISALIHGAPTTTVVQTP